MSEEKEGYGEQEPKIDGIRECYCHVCLEKNLITGRTNASVVLSSSDSPLYLRKVRCTSSSCLFALRSYDSFAVTRSTSIFLEEKGSSTTAIPILSFKDKSCASRIISARTSKRRHAPSTAFFQFLSSPKKSETMITTLFGSSSESTRLSTWERPKPPP